MTTRLGSRRLSPPTAVLALLLVVCLAPWPVSISSAQTSTTGNIEGTVVDVNGATVPNATITVTGQSGKSASTKTNHDGIFRITQLEPGRYGVAVEAPGFSRFEQANVEVNISKTTKLEVELYPAPARSGDIIVASPAPLEVTPIRVELTETMIGGTRLADLGILQGNLKLYLPDDMRAGDTISGTLVAEPKGANEADKAKNAQTLKTFVIDIQGTRVSAGAGPFSFDVPLTEVKPGEVTFEGKLDMRLLSLPNGNEVWKTSLPFTKTTSSGAVVPSDPKITPSTTSSGAVVTPDPQVSSNPISLPGPTTTTTEVKASTAGRQVYDLPVLGQQGRLLQIVGPFDGNATNTKVRFLPPTKETKPNYIADGIDVSNPVKPLAESPRQIVFVSPTTFEGPVRLFVSDAGQIGTGPYNNVNVRLSAPKTNLLRGEKTTVTIEVSGLSGIIKDVPLQLDAKGVINMDGGNFQNLRIKPEEVKLDGRYTTDRTITGLSPGGFNVTATVIVGPFDMCLQDDTDPNRMFRFNSFTGDYTFTNPGPAGESRTSGLKLQPGGGGAAAGQTGGKLQPGGGGAGAAQTGAGSTSPTEPTPATFTGIGKPAMKGCIITLSHNAPDRRVFAQLDTCTKSGDAKVETKSAKTTSEIKDKSTADNTCPSTVPK